jgi:uncharacterized protein (TIGR03790 family)
MLRLLLILLLSANLAQARRIGRVFVVANSNSEASLRIAQRYCELRKLPAWNLHQQPFADNSEMSAAEFATLLAAIPEGIDVVAFALDVPYRLGPLSVSGALMHGQPGHPWYTAEIAFSHEIELGMQRTLPSTYLAGYNVADTERMLQDALVSYPDRGSSGTFYFCTGVGKLGARNGQIDLAVQRVREAGGRAQHSRSHNLTRERDILGQFTGHTRIELGFAGYMPGSIIDNFNALGGSLRDQPIDTSTVGDFIHAGASAAYGTVHPLAHPARFANFAVVDHYLKGLPLFEAYLRSVYDWQTSMLVGDPLMAPFAKAPKASLEVKNGQAEFVVSGGGLAFAELWHEERTLLSRLQPVPPAGTPLRMSLTHGSTLNLQKEAFADGQHPASALLAEAGASAPLNIQFFAYRHKLLVRWRPSPLEFLNHRRARGSFRVELGEHASHVPLVFREITGECAVFDFGGVPPLRFDKLFVHIGDKTVTVEATGQESLRKFLISAAEELAPVLPPGWRAYHEQVTTLPSREELWIAARTPDMKRLPLRVEVQRGPRSHFAKSASWAKPWQRRAVARVAEAVIDLRWPISELRKTLPVPDGPLTLVARNGAGIETVVQHQPPNPAVSSWPLTSGISYTWDRRTLLLRGPFLHDKVRVTSAGRSLFVQPHPQFADTLRLDMSLFSRRTHALRIEGGPGETGGVVNVTPP